METGLRKALRGAAKLPFRAVGLEVTRRGRELDGWRYADLSAADRETVRAVMPYTLTSVEAVCALTDAVRHVVAHDVEGDIVECGVWRGGSMAAAARTLAALKRFDRTLYLFDTFEGMPRPGERDVNFMGERAGDLYRRRNGRGGGSDWCRASEEEVSRVMSACGYDVSKIRLVKGRVEETVPSRAPERISILRLDTDWYESTRHALEHLFPRLSRGGVCIVDDYGHWRGAREAADEYFARQTPGVYLHRVDYTVRCGVKM
ncbi:MAG TPA: TylF/MycF/NovP-related O-methyltransferase [Pyrinomonadaceae bacterium]|nr:TylF/MycF/NovP-related O-methyltransferase [Pyrinomonadaceae bacterium]